MHVCMFPGEGGDTACYPWSPDVNARRSGLCARAVLKGTKIISLADSFFVSRAPRRFYFLTSVMGSRPRLTVISRNGDGVRFTLSLRND